MADRDAIWALPLAKVSKWRTHALTILCQWILRGRAGDAEHETIRLSCIVLTWCLSTSHRPFRDMATKALAVLFETTPGLFAELLSAFAHIDDTYILKRLLAAGYGTACRQRSETLTAAFAEAVYIHCFCNEARRPHVLLRDYAEGIIELAQALQCLPPSIDIRRCRPPYRTKAVFRPIAKEELKQIADNAGGTEIYYSCGSMGDFYRYEIESHLREFTDTRLSQPKPLNRDDSLHRMKIYAVEWSYDVRRAYLQLCKDVDAYERKDFLARANYASPGNTEEEGEVKAALQEAIKSEAALLTLLNKRQRAVYRRLAAPHLFPISGQRTAGIVRFSTVYGARWICKRAYEMGWTKERFAAEPHSAGEYHPVIERIGKKYQWIALYELLALLADNYWLSNSWEERVWRYGGIADLEFIRDIEPTVLNEVKPPHPDDSAPWWLHSLPEYGEEDLKGLATWPFCTDFNITPESVLEIKRGGGITQLMLYGFNKRSERLKSDDFSRMHRRDAWYRVSSIIVPESSLQKVVRELAKHGQQDPHSWAPPQMIDAAYYGEYPWRKIWRGAYKDWTTADFGALERIRHLRPVIEQRWESHLDRSFESGFQVCLPSAWLKDAMGLSHHPTLFAAFGSESGEVTFFDPSVGSGHSTAALVLSQPFLQTLSRLGLAGVWVVAGEWTACPFGTHEHFATRGFTYLFWRENGKWRKRCRFEDMQRGLDTYLPNIPRLA